MNNFHFYRNKQKLCLSLLLSIFLLSFYSKAQDKDTLSTVIFQFSLSENIEPNAFRVVKKAIKQAENSDAEYLIMNLNTYGGRVDVADSIRTVLMRSKMKTISFININAASAGALISIACDSIYMTNGASIGASTVVTGDGQAAPDKYQSYMRSIMRSTAEAKNRNPEIAEAMVDQRIEIDGITKKDEVITFTTSEAIKYNFCEGQAESIVDIIENQLQIKDYKIIEQKSSSIDKIIKFLLNPVVSSVLMFMMIGGIWFEIQTPGVGFPIMAACIGAIFYFMPLYIEGIAQNWEIALFIVGLLLLILELFVIPGFGIFGILGILGILTSLTMSLVDNDFFSFSPEGISSISFPLIRVLVTFFITLLAIVFLTPMLFKQTRFNKLVLQATTSKEDGYTIEDKGLKHLIGKSGVSFTPLNPSGRVTIDGEIYEAKSLQNYLDKQEKIKVLRVELNYLIVKKIDS